jgi:SAM-dependent methyltransferase
MIEWKNDPVFAFEVDKNLIEKEQEKLKIFFEKYLPKDFKPKNILDFGCGIANEEPVLHDLYGINIEILSFDNSPSMVQTAKNIGRKSVIQSNTTTIIKIIQDKKFDLIIGRNIPINPNYRSDNNEYTDVWPEFLNNIKTQISQKGYLLMTFAREDEYIRAIKLLTENKFHAITKELNTVVIPSDKIGIAGADIKDNYVIISTI